MALYGSQLLSKIIDSGEVAALTRLSVNRDDYPSKGEQSAHDFIVKYAAENGGAAPSLATFVGACPDVEYIAGVTDSFEYLARELKDATGKRETAAYLSSPQLAEDFERLSTEDFTKQLTERLARITMGTNVRCQMGTGLPKLAEQFREEFFKRKAGKSFKLWQTPFPSLNEEIGGLYSGDIYGIMAESGRGKTYLSEVIVDGLLRQGAKVLVKSYEVKWYPWLARLFSIMTSHEGALQAEGLGSVGLPNKQILSGHLDEEVEGYFLSVLSAINDYYPGELILQAKGDADLTRTLADLNRELHIRPDIDVIVVDPFYGLSDVYGNNANKTTGGAAEQAARTFERIVGEHDVVGIFTIQAHTERQETEAGEQREIKLPKRDQVKTTKAVLEIATNLFSFDANNGSGRLGVEKGRNGGEGFTVELTALMDYGVLRELNIADEAAQFASGF